MFDGHYVDWRNKRIKKMLSILGSDFFNGKSVLELACGYGDIGVELQKLGANVTFTEGRENHLKILKERHQIDGIQLDQETDWKLEDQFDVVVHFGILYHLKNWRQDLICAIKHTKEIMFLESEIANSSHEDFEYENREAPNDYDQALGGLGIRPSAANVEKLLRETGVSFHRYDDVDLDSSFHKYSWEVNDSEPAFKPGQRRFWVIRKN